MTHWQPTASINTLRQRADTLKQVRTFFQQRQVMEVDTPALMPHTVTDPYMTALSVDVLQQKMYLQTSPEYAMKRLLAAGSGDIYQLAKNYRADEQGRKHQPEFTLLEWYRLGWDHHQLMDEVYELVSEITGITKRTNITYQQAFIDHLSLDPAAITDEVLSERAEQLLGELPDNMLREDYLSLLFAEKIEPIIAEQRIIFVYDFPASQSSLARLLSDKTVAGRFECYCNGLELANGFWELTDAKEQMQRFQHDQTVRQTLDRPSVDIDQAFIAALEHGLPDCSGVALGFDRLLMLALNKSDIRDVLPFAR